MSAKLVLYSAITLCFNGLVLRRYLRDELLLTFPYVLVLILPTVAQPFCQYFLGGFCGVFVFAAAVYKLYENLPQQFVNVKDKVVLITGCDTGLGHATALHLDSLGAHVFACCYDKNGTGERDLVANSSSRLTTIELDVTDQEQIQEALEIVKDLLNGRELWGMVNNAGVCLYGEAEITTVEAFKKMWEVNCLGHFRMVKTFLPLLRKSRGRIVNVTSMCDKVATPSFPAYCSSKAAALGFSNVLRMELKKWGIDVSIIQPGGFKTQAVVGTQFITRYQQLLAALDPKIADDYGKRYFTTALGSMYTSDDFRFLEDFSPVSVAVAHALFAKSPRAHYLCGPPALVLDWIASHLPAFVNDAIGMLVTGTYVPESALPNDQEKRAAAERRQSQQRAKNQRANMPPKQVHFKLGTSESGNQESSTNGVQNVGTTETGNQGNSGNGTESTPDSTHSST
ncbi:D-beta-hydroxybutyrate dehydrogenase, mitochondrial-like [Acanthaster planci]|uniref:D-beta-hydroxybutyrate dehydrogenase, mitochondrial-like n=1 Tax=Acanthaster planci TaxID=133434 RepID=A0A8B7Y4W0_ACAPL|nr:D-beta-hydroxybutyrate dehydrogenase, mitochondrial-like [Acanthaster planci]